MKIRIMGFCDLASRIVCNQYSLSDQEEVLGLGVADDDLLSDEDIQNYRKQLRKFKQTRKRDELGSDIEEDAAEDGRWL